MNPKTLERIMASIFVFILTIGAMVIGIGILLTAMEYGFFQVGVVIMTFLLLVKFSWGMGKIIIEHGYKN